MTPLGTNFQVTKQSDNIKMNIQNESNTSSGPSLYLHQTGATGQTYRLIIQVDKVRARPGPKSKKRELMKITTSNYKQMHQADNIPRMVPIQEKIKEEVVMDVDPQSTTKFQEEKLKISDDSLNKKSIQCSTCQHPFESLRALFLHQKKHYMCQFCDTPCESKLLCDRHEKMHLSNNPIFPYKCLLCSKTFDDKRTLKVHSKISHSESIVVVRDKSAVKPNDYKASEKSGTDKSRYQCEICRIIFKNEDNYRSHVKSHAVEVEMINGEITANTKKSHTNHETKAKFSCQTCSKEFDAPNELEAHSYVHAAVIEADRKCNICKKVFETEEMLNDHLAHHLSRAHHCVICRKAFINRTTLKNHMRTHRNIK